MSCPNSARFAAALRLWGGVQPNGLPAPPQKPQEAQGSAAAQQAPQVWLPGPGIRGQGLGFRVQGLGIRGLCRRAPRSVTALSGAQKQWGRAPLACWTLCVLKESCTASSPISCQPPHMQALAATLLVHRAPCAQNPGAWCCTPSRHQAHQTHLHTPPLNPTP